MQRNGKCYHEVFISLSWQASICLAYLLPLFFLSFFVLEKVFILWHNGMKILYIVDVIEGFNMKLAFREIEIEHNLEASLIVFWSQNWILLDVSIDSCLCKFVHIYVCFFIGVYKQLLCLLKIFHVDVKCKKILLYLTLYFLRCITVKWFGLCYI